MLSKNLSNALKSAREKIESISVPDFLSLAEDQESVSALSTVTSTNIDAYSPEQLAKLPETFSRASDLLLARLVNPEKCQDFEKLAKQLSLVNEQRLVFAVVSRNYPLFLEAHKALAVAKYVRGTVLGETAAEGQYALHEDILQSGADQGHPQAFSDMGNAISSISSFMGTLSGFWGKKAFNHQWCVSNFPYVLSTYFDGLGQASPAVIDKVIRSVSTTLTMELGKDGDIDHARIIELNQVFDSEIVSRLDTFPQVDAEAVRSSMANWYKALSALPAEVIENLSDLSTYYALDAFISQKFKGLWPEAEQKLELFVRRALDNGNYILASQAYIKGTVLAKDFDWEVRFAYGNMVVNQIYVLYSKHGPELSGYYISALRKLAALFIDRQAFAEAWEYLSSAASVPVEHLLNNHARGAYASACAELANLAGQAGQLEQQQQYLLRAAEMFDQAEMTTQARRMRSGLK